MDTSSADGEDSSSQGGGLARLPVLKKSHPRDPSVYTLLSPISRCFSAESLRDISVDDVVYGCVPSHGGQRLSALR